MQMAYAEIGSEKDGLTAALEKSQGQVQSLSADLVAARDQSASLKVALVAAEQQVGAEALYIVRRALELVIAQQPITYFPTSQRLRLSMIWSSDNRKMGWQ